MADDARYREYLASDHWRERRALALKTAGYKCSRCGKHGGRGGAGLQVHHLSYERLGSERHDDLEVLCPYCHRVRHGKLSRRERHRRRVAAAEVEQSRRETVSAAGAKADLIDENERLHLAQKSTHADGPREDHP